MATGLVAALGPSGSVTYTPQTNAKVQIAVSTNTATSLAFNGTSLTVPIGTSQYGPIFVGAGVALTITLAATYPYAIISSLES